MSDLRLEDLRLHAYSQSPSGRWQRDDYRAVTASEVVSVLSDADLLGELVRRGVLTEEDKRNWMRWTGGAEPPPLEAQRYISNWLPVGSVGETP